MNNNKLTNILLILLLIFNVAFLGKWWFGHHRQHHMPFPSHTETSQTFSLLHDRDKGEAFLVDTLGLDSIQQQKLKAVLAVHYAFFDKYIGLYVKTQSEFFNAMKNNPDSTVAFRCADSLGMIKVAMTRELFTHFSSIKNICNARQQKQYNQLIDNMSHEFTHRHDMTPSSKSAKDSLK